MVDRFEIGEIQIQSKSKSLSILIETESEVRVFAKTRASNLRDGFWPR